MLAATRRLWSGTTARPGISANAMSATDQYPIARAKKLFERTARNTPANIRAPSTPVTCEPHVRSGRPDLLTQTRKDAVKSDVLTTHHHHNK